MPAGSRTFQTLFNIAAKFTGGPAFAQANAAIDRTDRNAKSATTGFRGMAVGIGKVAAAIGASAIAWKTWQVGTDLAKNSFAAATEAKNVHDQLRLSMERLAAAGKLQPELVAKQTEEFIKLGDAMEKAGGIDAETLQMGMAGLAKYMSPDQINQMSAGWQDWMVKLSKGAPTMEQAAELSSRINDYIQRGRPQALAALGVTKEQQEAYKELNTIQERAAAVTKLLGNATGETAKWLETSAGKAYLLAQSQEALLERTGEPMVAAMDKIIDAQTEFYKALTPVADLLAIKLGPALDKLASGLVANAPAFAAFAAGVVEAIDFMVNRADRIQYMFVPLKIGIGVVQELAAEFQKLWANTVSEWEAISGAATSAWQVIQSTWSGAADWLGGIFQAIADQVEKLDAALKIGDISAAFAAWQGIPQVIWDTVCQPIINLFPAMMGPIASALGGVYNVIVAPFQSAYNTITGIFASIGSMISSALSGIQGMVSAAKGAAAGTSIPRGTGGGIGDTGEAVAGHQLGGLVAHPMISKLAERGIPEMVIPLQGTDRSRGLLSQAAGAIGMRKGAAAAGTIAPVLNCTVNVNVAGAATGQEGAIGREVQKAMQDPIRNLLDQLKAARAYESRLGYV